MVCGLRLRAFGYEGFPTEYVTFVLGLTREFNSENYPTCAVLEFLLHRPKPKKPEPETHLLPKTPGNGYLGPFKKNPKELSKCCHKGGIVLHKDDQAVTHGKELLEAVLFQSKYRGLNS